MFVQIRNYKNGLPQEKTSLRFLTILANSMCKSAASYGSKIRTRGLRNNERRIYFRIYSRIYDPLYYRVGYL